ncbi:MAG TPA: hypothetical protein VGR62_13900 [Candidatus Binatia bacterium]|nr:hypothetical protein [Candidatus Binatia bacterium]
MPDECTFRLFICLNRFEDGGACDPTDVAGVALDDASLVGDAALGPATRTAVLDALGAILARDGGTIGGDAVSVSVTPPLATLGRCGTIRVPVPVGQRRAVALRATDVMNAVDADLLGLTCTP